MPMPNPQTDAAFYSSLVTEHIVAKDQDLVFQQWHNALINHAQQQVGFVRLDLCLPLLCKDDVTKWCSIIHFDSPAHLHQWIDSPDRQRLFAAGQQIVQAYRFKSLTTGLEGWFARRAGAEHRGLGLSAWKQILSVVLGLYPVVMLQSQLFRYFGVMQSWPPATAMLVNNLITSSILTLAVMPAIARLLSFWLRPAYRLSSWKANLWGGTIVAIGLGCMVLIFNRF
jgi:uncharacterized protein